MIYFVLENFGDEAVEFEFNFFSSAVIKFDRDFFRSLKHSVKVWQGKTAFLHQMFFK